MNKNKMALNTKILIIIYFIMLFPTNLYAYIDAGSLSALFQLILAGIIGFIVYARNYIMLYLSKFRQLFNRDSENK
jgi:hypothetical protein